MSSLHLHLIKTIEGADHFVELQRRVWGGDPLEVVPNHVTMTVIKNGGALLGAYADDGPEATGGLVGAALWWLGVAPPADVGGARLKVCSHMAGVLPEWQGKRVGLLLKLRQRELVLEQGLTDWVTWTYDPLQRVNARFNLHRLGATCNTYVRNAYGMMTDALNAGAPSDRFQVDWRLMSERVRQLVAEPPSEPLSFDGVRILPTTTGAHALPQPVEQRVDFDGAPVAAPIPDDINLVRRMDQGLGLAWRLYLRELCEAAFAAGYRAVDCVRIGTQGWYYLLAQRDG